MTENLSVYVLAALASLIVLTVHEFFHGFVAYKLGDPTAKNLGRLTFNPLRHLDLFGTICLVLFHFGWAKPVPVNARYFKKPKRDFALVALAGPLSNLLVAFFAAPLALLFVQFANRLILDGASELVELILENTLIFLLVFIQINIGIALFNLIPVPPLDGSRLLTAILPTKAYFRFMRYERYIYLGLILWLLLGPAIGRFLLLIPGAASSPVISVIVRIFSLSDLLSDGISAISTLFYRFWDLII